MSKWFCSKEGGLDVAIKTAAYAAAFLIAKNNKELSRSILPVAVGIKTTVDGGSDNAALNSVLREAITELVNKVSFDAVIQAEVYGVLSLLNINIPEGVFPAFSNEVIIELVDSFVAGLTAGSV
jgi:hypothetical protein